MTSVSLARWVGPPQSDLLWMEDGAEAVVFDRRSRQTHVLNPAAAAALRWLVSEPLDHLELGRRLAPLLADSDGSAPDLALEILRTFDRLGLIEPA